MYAKILKNEQPTAFSYAKVLKFNPYHDAGGRFSDHEGHTFMSTGPKFSGTIARLKSQMTSNAKEATAKVFPYVQIDKYDQKAHAESWIEKTKNQYKSLDQEEQDAILAYTGSSSNSLNSITGKAAGGSLDHLSDGPRNAIKNLDSALNKMSSPEDLTLFRAGTISRMGDAFKSITQNSSEADLQKLVGQTFKEHSYASTTSSLRAADNFMSSGRVMFEIEAPKGTKGAWVGGSDRGQHPYEHEFVMPRGNSYAVVGIQTRPNPNSIPGDEKPPIKLLRIRQI
jgi:hypothetical protein